MTTGDEARETPTTIALVADGEDAALWAHALRGHGGVAVDVVHTCGIDAILESITAPEVAGVVFATPFADLPGAIKRGLIARKHILSAPVVTDSHLLVVLEELARSRQLALLFDAGELSDPRIGMVRRSTRAEHGLRRARYVRSTMVEPDAASIDDAAVRALSRVASMVGLPRSVTACGTSGEPEGPLVWTSVTARYEDGASATVNVSTLEPEPRDEMVVVSPARTFVLESGRAQLVSMGRAPRQDGGVREERSRPLGRTQEGRLSWMFLDAVRAAEFQSNARDLARAALMWEMARSSMRRGGEPAALPAVHPLVGTARPNLQVIVGGGHTTEAAEAPRLRVMAGGRLAEREAPVSPPPQSA